MLRILRIIFIQQVSWRKKFKGFAKDTCNQKMAHEKEPQRMQRKPLCGNCVKLV
jgi:hypothetical protein